MHATSTSSSALRLPAAFQRLAWSNLVAQSAEQISLAAAPLVAVFALGADARDTGLLQTAQTLPFLLLSIPSFWLAMTSFFLLGAGPILWVVGSTTLRQAITPERMMGRVSALISTATYGARPVGALLGAAISAHWSIDACLVVAAGAFLVQALIIVMSPAARLARIPEPGAAVC